MIKILGQFWSASIETLLKATGIETLRQMIACGEHYTLLPYLAVGKTPALKTLIDYRPLDGVGRTITLIYRQSYRNREKLMALKKIIIDNVPDELTILLK